MKKKTYAYWVPQTTSWSGGVSWFDTEPTEAGRFCSTRREAEEINRIDALGIKARGKNIKYRVVRRTVTETIYGQNPLAAKKPRKPRPPAKPIKPKHLSPAAITAMVKMMKVPR